MPYLTLDEIPEGRLCRPLFIPDDTMWLALFSGALTELTLPYNYQQFGTLTPQEMADACAEVIAQWYDDICGSCQLPDGDKIVRLNEDNVWQELENGIWQETTGDYYIPPPAAREEPTSEERRCLAAANATNTLQIMYEELTDLFGSALGTIEAITEWAGFIGAAILPGLGLAVRALLTIGVIAFKEIFDFTEFITADFWTSQFTDNMRCTLYECSSDDAGVVTFDFDCAWQKIKGQIEWLDPTIASAALAGQVLFMLNSIGAQGLNLAGATTAIEDAYCDNCGVEHCYEINFLTENGASKGWTTQGGTWVSGSGIQGANINTNNRSDAYGYWDFGVLVNASRIECEYTKTAGSGAGNVNNFKGLNPVLTYSTTQAGALNSFNALGSALTKAIDYDPLQELEGMGVDINSGTTTTNVYIRKLRVYYYGDIPSGWSDNCED